MAPGVGSAMLRIAAVIPVILLVLFMGLLWLLGFFAGRDRRRYVTTLSRHVMAAVGTLLHGPFVPLPPGGASTRARRR